LRNLIKTLFTAVRLENPQERVWYQSTSNPGIVTILGPKDVEREWWLEPRRREKARAVLGYDHGLRD
jgi:hypothetical protein